ncbi:hypothetical protein FRC12_003421 [Ceratobasidium sp. 428]|nr:hypothetical protein FRC12_003421 [Ceratobasidium sp. 428]
MLDKLKAKLHIDDKSSDSQQSLPAISHHSIDPSHIFPLPILRGFTTFPHCASLNSNNIDLLPLTDRALGVEKATPGFTHRSVEVDGVHAWEAFYPQGSINPQGKIKGGFGFYMCGPGGACEYECARDALFSYAIRFEDGFDFVKGGKIPGLYGGATKDLAYGCSGGRQESRDKCFSLRLMWRANGAAEIYAYIPSTPANEAALKDVPPMTHCNPDFGWSVARGSFTFVPGQWTTIAEHLSQYHKHHGTCRTAHRTNIIPSLARTLSRPFDDIICVPTTDLTEWSGSFPSSFPRPVAVPRVSSLASSSLYIRIISTRSLQRH